MDFQAPGISCTKYACLRDLLFAKPNKYTLDGIQETKYSNFFIFTRGLDSLSYKT